MSTDEELRQRFEQEEQNVQPSISSTPDTDQDDGGQDDGGGGFGAVPTPSISKRHVALIGVVVAVVIAYYLYRQESSSGSPPDGEFTGNVEFQAPDDEDDDDDIQVVVDSSNPMAADESVTEAFRDRGYLGGGDD